MKTFNGENLPKLKSNQFLVLQAELLTGIVLDLSGKRRFAGEARDWIVIFENLEEAKSFAEQKVIEYPDVECLIQNFDGQYKNRVFNTEHERNTNVLELSLIHI